jgi:DNA topoisomerase-1
VFEVDDIIYRNLDIFMQDKNRKKDLFGKINASELNKYIQDFMKGLTSKVFRTMNASKLFQKELNRITSKYESYDNDDKINLLLDEFNKANAKVALLCNHQKNINKGFKDQLNKINEKLKKYKKKKKLLETKKIEYKERKKDTKNIRKRIKKTEEKIRILKSKKKLKVELKNVSLGTSKINYIDPRITVSFMKKHNIEIDKLFTTSLQDKFKWAIDVDIEFKF